MNFETLVELAEDFPREALRLAQKQAVEEMLIGWEDETAGYVGAVREIIKELTLKVEDLKKVIQEQDELIAHLKEQRL